MKKAVVIFSGGQDSTTCLKWALNRYEYVEAITFTYGQKHSVEIECSKEICVKYKVRQTIVDISFLNTLVESALVSNGDVNQKNAIGLPASFVPNRNQLFITLAHSYAQKIGATRLVTGVCQTDFSGYPDCRLDFVEAIEETSNKGSGILSDPDRKVKILTPLMFLNKAQTFKLAEQEKCLEDVIHMSHTCYNGVRNISYDWGKGCGTCPACELRKKGYREFLETLNTPI